LGLEISVLALILFGGWFWVDSLRAREVALEAGRRACAAEGVQFLDWSVAVVKIRIGRSGDGRLQFRRIFEFEFSDTGNNRLRGSITLLGTQLIALYLAPREGSAPNIAHLH
jgi:hypothetical protein